MKNLLLIISCFLGIMSCKTSKKTTKLIPTLEYLWETDTLLTTVESVIYDSRTNLIYTTNIEGNFWEKDSVGSISKVSLEGKIINRDWISGLNAPTGTGIYKGRLFVTDIDRIVEIDIDQGKIVNSFKVEGAKSLNDIEVTRDGTVYASDTGGNQIFSLKDNIVSRVVDSINTPNGLLEYDKKLLVTCWTPKTLNYFNLQTRELTKLTDSLDGPDGVEAIKGKGFLVSGFNGFIHLVNDKGDKKLLLDSSKEKIRAADIDFIEDKEILLVPTMQNNKVMAYKLKWKDSDE